MDRIIIKDLKIYGYHGVNPEEKRDGQNFVLDIIAELDLSRACLSDDLNDTVSYAKIIKTVWAAFNDEKFDLIERAAQYSADVILNAFPQIGAVEITLKKPEAPIRADFSWVAVEIRRGRNG